MHPRVATEVGVIIFTNTNSPTIKYGRKNTSLAHKVGEFRRQYDSNKLN